MRVGPAKREIMSGVSSIHGVLRSPNPGNPRLTNGTSYYLDCGIWWSAERDGELNALNYIDGRTRNADAREDFVEHTGGVDEAPNAESARILAGDVRCRKIGFQLRGKGIG